MPDGHIISAAGLAPHNVSVINIIFGGERISVPTLHSPSSKWWYPRIWFYEEFIPVSASSAIKNLSELMVELPP